jgi:hypothetical protein
MQIALMGCEVCTHSSQVPLWIGLGHGLRGFGGPTKRIKAAGNSILVFI